MAASSPVPIQFPGDEAAIFRPEQKGGVFAAFEQNASGDPRAFKHLVTDICQAFEGDEVVLVFDQFEEILRISANETMRIACPISGSRLL